MISDFETIINDYGWNKKDELHIREIKELIGDDKEIFTRRFSAYLGDFEEIRGSYRKKRRRGV